MSEVVDLIVLEAEDRMEKAVAHAKADFSTVRTGRASPVLIEKLPVHVYGADVPLQQVAGFSVPEARMLVINPYDKSQIGAIEKAIRVADLGLNPSNDGNVIRLAFPPLTEERRRELVRKTREMAESQRLAVRAARRDARKELENLARDGEASEDDVARGEKELDRVTHLHEAEIDNALAHKEAELLEV